MSTLLVTSLSPRQGKTAFAAGLGLRLQQEGRKPALLKAISFSHPDSQAQDSDATLFQRMMKGSSVALPVLLSPSQEAHPLPTLTRDQIKAAVGAASALFAPVIVEGPSLVTASGQPSSLARELAAAIEAHVALVIQPASALTAATVLEAARSFGPRLAGVVINGVRQHQRRQVETSLVAPLKAAGIPVLAVLHEDRRLLGVSVEAIAHHLGGQIIVGNEKREQLVDHLMIGGNVVDWGVLYFSQCDSKAVLVRGDRPDIQMAALHTPTRCLVLTGGHQPLQYVRHQALQEEVPIVVVQPSTLEAAKSAETLFDNVTVHHQDKIERMSELLKTALDRQALAPVTG